MPAPASPADLAGRRVLVVGGGVSGRAVIPVAVELGARVTVADASESARRICADLGVRTVDLDAPQLIAEIAEFDLVVTSPGPPPSTPVLAAAAAASVPVWGDVEFSWWIDRAEVLGPARTWLVVTGTNGKTTTTSMVEAIVSAADRSVVACGNIGLPVLDAMRRGGPRVDVLAVELSSFQLFWAPSVRPDAGVVLNIAEDHLDWHGSMRAYAEAKLRALSGAVAVVGLDDPGAAALVPRAGAPVVRGYTAGAPTVGGFGVVDGQLVDHTGPEPVVLAPTSAITPAGPAGLQDALAAAALTRAIGVSATAVREGLSSFTVGPHRAAVVREVGGVRFVDDSKATNPHAARASILSYPQVVWLTGGLLKGADVSDLVAEVASRLLAAVVFGRDGDVIAAALARHAPDVPVVRVPSRHDTHVAADTSVTDGDEVMRAAVRAAAARAHPGATVLLAPSTASFDQFRNYGHRGDSFAAAAHVLTAADIGTAS